MEENAKQNYISLLEAARLCSYSEPYLRLRARQGKLKSIKLGKKWMTTAAWIDDYDLRVQRWRESSEAKKSAAMSAVLVSAPAVLAKVVCRPGADIEPALLGRSQGDAVPMERGDMLLKAGNCRLHNASANQVGSGTAKRRLATGLTGQMFPIPEQKPVNDTLGYGWFGALLSGAAIALLLFMVADSDGVLKIMNAGYGAAGQASIVRTIPANDAIAETKLVSEAKPVIEDGALKELVRRIARVFSDF